MLALLVALIALLTAAPVAQAQVQVHVDIGFHLPAPPRLALSSQCGFASGEAGNPVTPEQQDAKLRLVSRVARTVWAA